MAAERVFIAHDPADEAMLRELTKQLSALANAGPRALGSNRVRLEVWDTTRIPSGSDRLAETQRALDRSRILVALVSASFLASDLSAMLERRARAGGHVIPVLVAPCLLDYTWLAERQALPLSGRPIKSGTEAQQAEDWADVARRIAWLSRSASTIEATFVSAHSRLPGRDKELSWLETELLESDRTTGVLIRGIGGMGKTALAREICQSRDLWRRFDRVVGTTAKSSALHIEPDGPSADAVTIARYEAVANLRQYLDHLARDLGVPFVSDDKQLVSAIRRKLGEGSALVLLDNLETLPDVAAALELLGSICSPGHKVLVTTRVTPKELPGGFVPLKLGRVEAPADREIALDFLRSRDRALEGTEEERALDAILRAAAGHPLAIQLLAGRLALLGGRRAMEPPAQDTSTSEEIWLGRLFDFVFDERMEKELGELGCHLLELLASLPHGTTEDELRRYSMTLDPPPEPGAFDEALRRFWKVSCVDIVHGAMSIHPLTRRHFAGAPDSQGGTGS